MRNSLYKFAMVVSLVTLVTGCVGTKTFKEFNVNEGTSISIDATQRVVLVNDTLAFDNKTKRRMVCAEPSPDAMVAAAAHAALKAEVAGQGGGELSGGFAQMASTIGIRTVTVQLLRDGYFRACEASMNGMLNDDSYGAILAGIGPVMTGLLAIDGLTQMKPAPTVSIGGIGGAATTKEGTKADNNVVIKVEPQPAPPQFDVSKVADKVLAVVKEVNRALKVMRDDLERMGKERMAHLERMKELDLAGKKK